MDSIESLLQKARIQWVVSVDDCNSCISQLDKSEKIRLIAKDLEEYKLFLQTKPNINIDALLEFPDEDTRYEYLNQQFIDDNLEELNIKYQNSQLEVIVKTWQEKDIIKEYLLKSSVTEAKQLLKNLPENWKCDQNNRILWLIDRDFSEANESTDAGIEFIQEIAQQELQDNICLLLTAKTDLTTTGMCNQIHSNERLRRYFNLISVVSKDNFFKNSSDAVEEIITGLWSNYNYLMITQLANYLTKGLDNAKGKFLSLTSSAAKHLIINFPSEEGVSVPETIHRILMILTSKEFGEAYSKDMEKISQLLVDYKELEKSTPTTESDKNMVFDLRHNEMYDNNVNALRQTIGFGDIFEINNELFVLLSQPCDVAYRGQNGRNLNEALLGKLAKIPADKDKAGRHYSEPLKFLKKDHEYWLDYREFILIDFNLLDLCVFSSDGVAKVLKEAVEKSELNESEYKLIPYKKQRIDEVLIRIKKMREMCAFVN